MIHSLYDEILILSRTSIRTVALRHSITQTVDVFPTFVL
jgi:hypothetical protein